MDDNRLTETKLGGPRRKRYVIRTVEREEPTPARRPVASPTGGAERPPANAVVAALPGDSESLARRLFARSRHDMIAEAAYHRAARRGFAGGDPDRDWYEAEAEIEALLRASRPV